jgi:flavin reductase (DIM6/NTAB) family NADH-FMN oxidoreductase RutF
MPELTTAEAALRERVRSVHRRFPSGVAVVTTAVDGRPYGLAVNAFSSVSMEPPLVLVCVKNTAKTHEHLYRGERLGINFLAHDQRQLAERFATSGGNKFIGVAWRLGAAGVPMLEDVSAYLEVRIEQRLAAATHTIFLGEVLEADAPARPPLVFFEGAFFDGAELHPVAGS